MFSRTSCHFSSSLPGGTYWSTQYEMWIPWYFIFCCTDLWCAACIFIFFQYKMNEINLRHMWFVLTCKYLLFLMVRNRFCFETKSHNSGKPIVWLVMETDAPDSFFSKGDYFWKDDEASLVFESLQKWRKLLKLTRPDAEENK